MASNKVPLLSKERGPPPLPPPRPYPYRTPPRPSPHRTPSLTSNEMVSVVIEVPPEEIQKNSSFHQSSLMNDNYLVLSIGLTLISICFGCFPALLVSIPAIVYSIKARKACKTGDYEKMRLTEKTAFALNIFVFLIWIVTFTIVVTVTYRVECGMAGIKCNTSPYKVNHQPEYNG